MNTQIVEISREDWTMVMRVRWGRKSKRILIELRTYQKLSLKQLPRGISWYPTPSRVGGINSVLEKRKIPFRLARVEENALSWEEQSLCVKAVDI